MVLKAMAGVSGSSVLVSQDVGCRPRNTQCCFRPGQAPTSKKLIVLKGMHGGPQPRGPWRCLASAEPEVAGDELENPESESARKKAEADRLRAAEKFMVVGTGEAECGGCGYEYSPKKGDPEYPISPGVFFNALPADWSCPICGAPKDRFNSRAFEVAGFAENQKYGLGTNSMTSGQKSLLIFGSLFAFFLLFIAGYFIE